MPKYVEKTPLLTVDIDKWDPDHEAPHIAVAIARLPDGTATGTIHFVDGTIRAGIAPGDLIVTYPEGSKPQYGVVKPEDLSAFWEPLESAAQRLAALLPSNETTTTTDETKKPTGGKK